MASMSHRGGGPTGRRPKGGLGACQPPVPPQPARPSFHSGGNVRRAGVDRPASAACLAWQIILVRLLTSRISCSSRRFSEMELSVSRALPDLTPTLRKKQKTKPEENLPVAAGFAARILGYGHRSSFGHSTSTASMKLVRGASRVAISPLPCPPPSDAIQAPRPSFRRSSMPAVPSASSSFPVPDGWLSSRFQPQRLRWNVNSGSAATGDSYPSATSIVATARMETILNLPKARPLNSKYFFGLHIDCIAKMIQVAVVPIFVFRLDIMVIHSRDH
jgi:hypothetical protein